MPGCPVGKNEKLGRKLFITGKGRCNLTNACDMDGLFENVVTNPKFLYSAFYGFDNRMVMEWFEKAGCPVKTERGRECFRFPDHSSDVTGALVRQLKRWKAEVRTGVEAKSLAVAPEEPKVITGVKLADGTVETADAVIIATGGLSYP